MDWSSLVAGPFPKARCLLEAAGTLFRCTQCRRQEEKDAKLNDRHLAGEMVCVPRIAPDPVYYFNDLRHALGRQRYRVFLHDLEFEGAAICADEFRFY